MKKIKFLLLFCLAKILQCWLRIRFLLEDRRSLRKNRRKILKKMDKSVVFSFDQPYQDFEMKDLNITLTLKSTGDGKCLEEEFIFTGTLTHTAKQKGFNTNWNYESAAKIEIQKPSTKMQYAVSDSIRC